MEGDFYGNFPQIAGNAAELNARCQEELALVRTFFFFLPHPQTFPGINNVNPILLGFNLMNQNEALAHKSLARCHAGASQLELWGALLFLHYSQTAAAGGGLVAAVGLLVEAPPPQIFYRCIKSVHMCVCVSVCFQCTCECVWMQPVQVFGFLLTLPPLSINLVVGRVGSDDVAQRDGVRVFWRT